MFSMQSVSYNPIITTFQLSSAASLNLGRSQKWYIREWVKNTEPVFTNHSLDRSLSYSTDFNIFEAFE